MTDRILIFVPCYNCEPQIGRVIARVAALPAGFCDEVLVVDNISRDGTIAAARDACAAAGLPRWKVVRNHANYSLGGSHKVAFDYAVAAGFSHVIVLHGDDQADIADMVPPVAAGLHRRYDSLLGARFMRGSRLQGYSLYRTLGNYGLNAISSVLTRRWIVDQGSGLNLYATSYLASGFYRDLDDGLIFPAVMYLHGIRAKSRYRFVPISWREEDQVSNARAVKQALRIMRLALARELGRPEAGAAARGYGFDVIHEGGAAAGDRRPDAQAAAAVAV